MTPRLLPAIILAANSLILSVAAPAADPALRTAVAQKVAAEQTSLETLYRDLHAHPELSLMEERTAGVMARELRAAGFEVTEKFGGGFGVVGVFRNGAGPTVLIRTDLDGLPVQEETGLAYASKVRTKNLAGQEVSTMHACGHDIHMACFIGAARIVLALQTIASRENRPIDPVVVTVGSIHGGTKHNIIPDEVHLQLTIRTYADDVRARTLDAVRRICRGEAIAAGVPEDRFPTVKVSEQEYTPATYNDPALTRRLRGTFVAWLGADRVRSIDPEMGGEDFGRFGRTVEKVPICLIRIGAVAPETVAASERTGAPLPSLHSNKFAPVPGPTIQTGVTAMAAAALELLLNP